MKIILKNSSMVFQQLDVIDITNQYGVVSVGWNEVVRNENEKFCSIVKSSVVDLRELIADGYDTIILTPQIGTQVLRIYEGTKENDADYKTTAGDFFTTKQSFEISTPSDFSTMKLFGVGFAFKNASYTPFPSGASTDIADYVTVKLGKSGS